MIQAFKKEDYAKVSEIIHNFLQRNDESQDQTADDIFSTNVNLSVISSVFWTFINISKNSPYETRIKLLGIAIVSRYPTIVPYFLLTMDKNDWSSMGITNIKSFMNYFKSFYQSSSFNQNQFFKDCPEGFARLLLSIYNGKYDDLVQICGGYRIDPNVALDIVFEVFDSNPTNDIFNLIKQFPSLRVYQFLLHRMKTQFTAGVSRIVGYFYENELFNDKFLLSLYTTQKEAFFGLYKYYQQSAKRFCDELMKPLTIFPGESKESSYKASYIEARRRFNEAKDVIESFPLFLMLKKLEGDDFIHALKVLSKFDPCQIEGILNSVKKIVLDSLETENLKYDLLIYLGGHECDPNFVNMILDIPDLDPMIYSYFILPAIAMSDVPWQLSVKLFENLKSRFTFAQRREIYDNFDKFQSVCVEQMLIVSNTIRKISFTMRRVTKDTASKFAPKFSRLMLRSPEKTARGLIEFIGDKVPYDNDTVINLVSCLSPLSYDMLLGTFLRSIDQKLIVAAGKNVSDWPQDIATFLSNVFRANYKDMDLPAYVNILHTGIVNMSTAHVCLFGRLVERMCGVEYRGNLTPQQYNERYADNYLNTKRRVLTDDVSASESFTRRSKYMKDCLHENDIGVKIIAALDVMKRQLPSLSETDSLSDRLDQIQFTIIESCEPMDLMAMKIMPNEIIEEHGLSLECAFHLARQSCTEESARQLSPPEIPSDLFEMFWRLSPSDFHVPNKFVDKVIQDWQERASKVADKAVIDMNIAILTASRERQQKRSDKNYEKMRERGTEWFKDDNDYWNFVKLCVIPRTLFSEYDAVFSAFFVNALFHTVEHIDVMKLLNAVLRNLHFIVYSSTIEEAHSFAIFIVKVLKSIRYMEEREEINNIFLDKLMILLRRLEINCLLNTIEVCYTVSKEFPEKEEHFDAIFAELEEISKEYDPPPEILKLKMISYTNQLKVIREQKQAKRKEKEEKEKAAKSEIAKEETRQAREKAAKEEEERRRRQKVDARRSGPHIDDKRRSAPPPIDDKGRRYS
ncbi:mRNA transport, partial [Trichomonas vaginalis G3]|uniref:mRNA transport n=1 Tax=Trichomonas vaginalis (strain ATCC PRA-98 / G3) TaxID=412133 RepID=UPI0021E5A86F